MPSKRHQKSEVKPREALPATEAAAMPPRLDDGARKPDGK